METVRTLVVDDELPARTRLLTLLHGRSGIHVVGAASDGDQAVALIREQRPHLVFLDIQMPGRDGFGVLRAIKPSLAPVSIFVTAYDRYAIAAFEAHALDYLLKPFSDERFDSALARAILSIRTLPARDRQLQIESVVEERSAVNASSGYLDRIVLKEHGRVVLLHVDEVDWIAAAGVYLELHVGKVTYLYRSSLARAARTPRSGAVRADSPIGRRQHRPDQGASNAGTQRLHGRAPRRPPRSAEPRLPVATRGLAPSAAVTRLSGAFRTAGPLPMPSARRGRLLESTWFRRGTRSRATERVAGRTIGWHSPASPSSRWFQPARG